VAVCSFFAKIFLCVLGCFFDLGLETVAGCVNYRRLKSTIVNHRLPKSTNVNKSQQAATTTKHRSLGSLRKKPQKHARMWSANFHPKHFFVFGWFLGLELRSAYS
jgi:exoribonuclease II